MEKVTGTPGSQRNYFQEAKEYYQKNKKKYFGKRKKKPVKIELNEDGLLGAVRKRNKALKDASEL